MVKDFKQKDFKVKTKFFFLILSFFSSCSDEFEPRSYLTRLEVLALKQDGPLLLTEESELNITSVTFETTEDTIKKHTWTLCPVSKGSRSNYECAIPICKKEIPGNSDKLSDKIKDLLGTPCLAILKEKDPKQALLTILYTVESKQGEKRVSLLELPLSLDGSALPLATAPAISEVKINNEIITNKFSHIFQFSSN